MEWRKVSKRWKTQQGTLSTFLRQPPNVPCILKMYLLFNYQQLLRDGLGWNVAARGAVAACWLSISLCNLIHSLDSLLGPRESDQSMFRRQGRCITGADETLDSWDTEDSWIVCSSFQTKIFKKSGWILPHWWALFVMYNIHFSIFVARLTGSSICTLMWDRWKVHFLSYEHIIIRNMHLTWALPVYATYFVIF